MNTLARRQLAVSALLVFAITALQTEHAWGDAAEPDPIVYQVEFEFAGDFALKFSVVATDVTSYEITLDDEQTDQLSNVKLHGSLRQLAKDKVYLDGDVDYFFEKRVGENEKLLRKGTLKWAAVTKPGQTTQIGRWGDTTLTMKIQAAHQVDHDKLPSEEN